MRRPVRAALAVTASLTAAWGVVSATAPDAAADPYQGRDYVKTIRCNSADPWGGPPLRIFVDVYNKVRYPSDGLPGPAIELIASNPRAQGLFPNLTEVTVSTTVRWRNTTTGRTGTVRVPTRANRATWQAVLHPGSGHVNFRIEQRIGAMAFVPMVNPQVSRCSGAAVAS